MIRRLGRTPVGLPAPMKSPGTVPDRLLHDTLEPTCRFWGYDISPQALEMCKTRATPRLPFRLGDVRQEEGAFFDLMLINDVIEHVAASPFIRT